MTWRGGDWTGWAAPVTAADPIDQIWEQAPDRLTFDGLYVEASGMPSAVVWNPGPNEVGDIGSAYRGLCLCGTGFASAPRR